MKCGDVSAGWFPSSMSSDQLLQSFLFVSIYCFLFLLEESCSPSFRVSAPPPKQEGRDMEAESAIAVGFSCLVSQKEMMNTL